MVIRALLAACVVALATGCGGGDDSATTTTTTSPATTEAATTTTIDPEPIIRQYASAVAPALARFTSGEVCSSRPTCAMEQAASWETMMDDLEAIDEFPPAEIQDLVLGILEADRTFRPFIDGITGCLDDYKAMGDPVAGLTECDPLVTVFDGMWASDATTALERWRPYL